MKLKLIDNWKAAPKFASVQWSVLGLVLMVLLEAVQSAWVTLPPTVLTQLPNATVISAVLFGLVAAGRVLMLDKD